jgi:hypothetical protein
MEKKPTAVDVNHYVLCDGAYWGDSDTTFELYGDQVRMGPLFVMSECR